jgi:hypothetical protein
MNLTRSTETNIERLGAAVELGVNHAERPNNP